MAIEQLSNGNGRELDRPQLLLLRHGESVWNASGRFTGRTDVELSGIGRQQAKVVAEQLIGHGLFPDLIHTSSLSRASESARLIRDRLMVTSAQETVPLMCEFDSLRERDYGALEGRTKREVAEELGKNRYRLIRRGIEARPPAPAGGEPGESLRDVIRRVRSYWNTFAVPELDNGTQLLVVSHSNALRALVMLIERMSEQAVTGLNVPNAMPLIYAFRRSETSGGRIVGTGRYLDPEQAARSSRQIADEGLRQERA